MQNYKELVVWNRGMELAVAGYEVAAMLPKHEIYALADQIRGSAISIPSNIAEEYGRSSTRDYVRFLSIARGSRYELETQLLLCVKLGYIGQQEVSTAVQLGTEVGKMLNRMISRLEE